MQKDADAEGDVYNHLANFFGRYYAEGDFISQRRYSSGGRSAYLIPYDGEEVKLHSSTRISAASCAASSTST